MSKEPTGTAAGLTNKFQRQDTATLPNSNIINILPLRSSCVYTSGYCEENVWKMCEDISSRLPSELQHCYVVFVSNKARTIPLWRQRAGETEDKLVIYDYHTMLLYMPSGERCVVYDLDSELPFPTHFHKYVTETFRTDQVLDPDYFRYFRVVPAAQYLQNFASDRRHWRKADNTWLKTPPSYPLISTSASSHNMDQYVDMDQSKGPGQVLNLTQIVKRFYQQSSQT
ncbi:hypothetical protein FOCC_FOCC002678 [Frankliniella occidentalis]|uniref:Protein N-terminal glutamine amidohydrolase n=1 Tax=Frankliniella occidentalis TaxID=133901 RepID=A0A6J1SNZ8_FRAOC|nr:protein N-terminal glutamine amidohydrolase [Frankliniella occidentalis]XP_026281055.1 protein N-terminal glutamine amidohydrolase [Frankliniella occidentalis]XP_052119979.1 protein N-terminal glutamine amidohydrolase [Frankliniella occidentalis]KAE8750698.1 hypothetical protein FOCC_FOCC002678 [Frankliniella occidentalis]